VRRSTRPISIMRGPISITPARFRSGGRVLHHVPCDLSEAALRIASRMRRYVRAATEVVVHGLVDLRVGRLRVFFASSAAADMICPACSSRTLCGTSTLHPRLLHRVRAVGGKPFDGG